MSDELDLTVVDRLLTTTRAVRRRMIFDKPVDPAVIRECIRIATYAPNARNEQDWRWIVVDRPAQIAEIVKVLRSDGAAPGRTTGRPVPEAVMSSAGHLSVNMHRVPALVFATILNGLPADANHRQASDFYGSIITAVWSFQLALRARQLGSVFTTGFLGHEEEIAALLSIPPNVTQIAMIPVGHYEGTLIPPPRGPVDDVLYWGKWGAKRP